MEKRYTYEQRLALGIIAAHNIGVSVNGLELAEDVIIRKKHVEPCEVLWFEQCFIEAHQNISKGGQSRVDEANAEVRNIINKHLR
jgi:hypothetical protein